MQIRISQTEDWYRLSFRIYKTEKYLVSPVNSVLQQSYRNIEIILVDDGSPDDCPAICDELSEKHANVRGQSDLSLERMGIHLLTEKLRRCTSLQKYSDRSVFDSVKEKYLAYLYGKGQDSK